jgi:hypothetical protein
VCGNNGRVAHCLGVEGARRFIAVRWQCRRLHAFADGELGQADRDVFKDHLQMCVRCRANLEAILQLKGLAETVPSNSAPPVTQQIAIPHRRPLRLWAVDLATVAALVAVAVMASISIRTDEPWTLPDHRALEARLSDPRADVYRPLRPMRGPSERGPDGDFQTLARLQERGDTRGLVSRLLVDGDASKASLLLDAVSTDRTLDNERAVVALIQGRYSEAIGWLDRASATQPRSPQGLWNRALALREMGLAQSAAEAFGTVAALREAGWSSESAIWANKLRSSVSDRKARYAAARAQVDRLVERRLTPDSHLIDRWPELVRVGFYDALRGSPDAQAAGELLPLARKLDDHFGGRVLEGYTNKVRAKDFRRRGEVAKLYPAFAKANWKESRPGELGEYAASLRSAGDNTSDLLIGLLVAQPRLATSSKEVLELAAASPDPWWQVEAMEAQAALDLDTRPGGGQERTLQSALDAARRHGFVMLQLRLQSRLTSLLLRQLRSIEAAPVARALFRASQASGLWPQELTALTKLLDVATYQQDAMSVAVHAHEIELVDEPCGPMRGVALERLAERLIFEGRASASESALQKLFSCPSDSAVRGPALIALSELARFAPDGQMAKTFRRELTKFRNLRVANGPTAARSDGLLLNALEGRALLDSDRARGRDTLEQVIRETEKEKPLSRELALPRLSAYRRLITDAVKHREFDRAMTLIARESELRMPSGCVVGISEDLRKAAVTAKTPAGYVGGSGQPASATAPEQAVPREVRAALSSCSEVSVIAQSPLRGRARLLPPETAWRHVAGNRPPSTGHWRPERRIVISDITASRGASLPSLPAWQPRDAEPIHRHLRGPEATPTAVLAEMSQADLVEFHVHGIANFHFSDAPYLLLSEDQDGNARLSSDAIKSVRLTRGPLVVLAACESASNSPFFPSYSGRFGLPAAFLDAGARAVLAADKPLPDGPATEFVASVLARMRSGASGATALRDARVEWLKRPDADWVNDVVIFE